ncbi:MAG TPA: phosphatidylglycerol lysyltransferase domain-containing protein [Mycobacteriales bacterium]
MPTSERLRPDAADGQLLARSEARLRRWVPPLLSLLVLLAGVVDVISVLTPEIRERLHAVAEVIGGPAVRTASAGALVLGVVLVLLARGLRRRKRRAWVGALVALVLSAVLDVLKGLDVEEALLSLAVAALLVGYRKEFAAAGDPRTRWRGLGAFGVLLVTSVVLGELLVVSRLRAAVGPHGFGRQLQHVVYGLVGVHGPLVFRTDRSDDFVTRGLFGLGLLTVVITLYLVLRPAEPQARLAADDEERMRALLARFGDRDSLGYFALRRDKSVLWSPSGKSCIAYRVVSGVMLASGDPLGDPEAWPGAIGAFLDEAARHAWTPAVMGCSEQAGTAWQRAGLDVLELGDEAIVHTDAFSLDGRSMRNVRQAVGRVERAGYDFSVRRARDIPPAELEAIGHAARSWRGAETERGFSMALGRFADAADGDCAVATASKDGRLAALLHFVPWGEDGLSLELMVRDRAADNGMNEFLIARLLDACPALGVARVSLNFAVFRSALARGERLGAGFVLRAWRSLLVFASRWFQIESLYRFNAKFQPDWEPRFVCYPAARDIPRIAVAALEAEAFIVWPLPRLRFLQGIVGGPHPAVRA